MSEQFIRGLHAAKGTLQISAANVLEFAKIEFEVVATAAEELLEACLPRIFLLESDPGRVIANEDSLMAGNSVTLAPHADPELIGLLPVLASGSIKPITLRGLFAAVVSESALQASFSGLGVSFLDEIARQRGASQPKGDLKQPIGTTTDGPSPQRLTRLLLTEVLRSPILNQQMNLSENDGIDYLHTVVPTAYSDIVLLDRRWATLSREARNRLEQSGHTAPMALTFAGRKNGLENFFEELSSRAVG